MLSTLIQEKYYHPEKQYLAIVKEICVSGNKIEGRNGFTYSKNGASMYFNLENNTLYKNNCLSLYICKACCAYKFSSRNFRCF